MVEELERKEWKGKGVEISSWKWGLGFGFFSCLEVSLTLSFCNSNTEFSNASLREGGNKRNWQKWKWNSRVPLFCEPKMKSTVVKLKLILNIFKLIVVGMYRINNFLAFEVRWYCLTSSWCISARLFFYKEPRVELDFRGVTGTVHSGSRGNWVPCNTRILNK